MLWLIVIPISLVLIGIFCYWQNNGLMKTELEYENKRLPNGFDGMRIVQISDLHNKRFGEKQQKLLCLVREIEPEAIFITGDLIDKRRPGLAAATEFVQGAVEIAPTYYVPGNHEKTSDEYEGLKLVLKEGGVAILENRQIQLERNGDTLFLAGMKDFSFYRTKRPREVDKAEHLARMRVVVRQGGGGFRILLSHRPELFDLYHRAGVDLVFSGHAHGGQARLPIIGGLYAPGQGVFPRYTSGVHQHRHTSLVVSRGLGNSSFPLRMFNRPEVVAVTLVCQ